MNDKTVTLPREVARRLLLCFECHDITGGDIDTLRASLEAAQPAGEPVAWRTFDGEGRYEFQEYDNNEGYKDAWESKNPTHKGWVEPLYTHPAPQVPMTDAELEELYWDHSSYQIESMDASGWINFARAVEAHHKIGVKP